MRRKRRLRGESVVLKRKGEKEEVEADLGSGCVDEWADRLRKFILKSQTEFSSSTSSISLAISLDDATWEGQQELTSSPHTLRSHRRGRACRTRSRISWRSLARTDHVRPNQSLSTRACSPLLMIGSIILLQPADAASGDRSRLDDQAGGDGSQGRHPRVSA